MTISASYKPLTYIGNGVTTNFVITWKFFDKEIEVTDEEGNIYSGYEVINSNSGGTVIFKNAPTGKVIISRKVPLNQSVEFNEGEDFPAEDYEYSLDRIYMSLQDMGYEIGRAVSVPQEFETVEEFLATFVKVSNNGYWSAYKTYDNGDICVDEQNFTLYLRTGGKIYGIRPSDNQSGWTVIANYLSPENVERLIESIVNEKMKGYYTKDETVSLINSKTQNFYTKTETTNLVDGKVKDFYTKDEIDGKIGDIDTVLDSINGEVI